MNPDERDRVMVRLLAVWQTPLMSDATRVVWNEFLSPLEFHRAKKALDSLQLQMPRRPAYSDFHEAYAAQPGVFIAVGKPECGMCEDGWVWAPCGRDYCDKEFCAVTRCPNGCTPPTRDGRDARLREESFAVDPGGAAHVRAALALLRGELGMQEQNQALNGN